MGGFGFGFGFDGDLEGWLIFLVKLPFVADAPKAELVEVAGLPLLLLTLEPFVFLASSNEELSLCSNARTSLCKSKADDTRHVAA